MPIPPHPYTLRCPACGWKKTMAPLSDVLRYGVDWLDCCPQCGHKHLQKTQATPFEIALIRLKRRWGIKD